MIYDNHLLQHEMPRKFGRLSDKSLNLNGLSDHICAFVTINEIRFQRNNDSLSSNVLLNYEGLMTLKCSS